MYTRRLSLASLAIVVLCLFAAPAVKADEIALWNFNDSNLIVDRGLGTLTTTANPANVIFLSGTTGNARMGDPAGMAVAIQGGANLQNNGSILELRASTAGFNSVMVSWAWQRTTTGFNNILMQFSEDGTTFIDLAHVDPPSSFVATNSVGFSASGGTFNNPLFAFRWVLNGATNANGNVFFDNLVVEGTPVPEPATMLLLGTGVAGIAARTLKRRKNR